MGYSCINVRFKLAHNKGIFRPQDTRVSPMIQLFLSVPPKLVVLLEVDDYVGYLLYQLK